MNAGERGVVGSHAVILQAWYRGHPLLGHILLSEDNSELLGAVVAEVEENHHVAFLDAAIYCAVNNGLDELIGHALVIALLDSLHHVVALATLAMHELVVGQTDALPALVAVHGIVAASDSCHHAGTLGAMLLELCHKALAALGVGVATVHKAVDIHLAKPILLGDVAQRKKVVERTMNATIAGKTHEVDGFSCLLGIAESVNDLGISQNRLVANCLVDFHEVLINHASAANVQMPHLAVAHLPVGQSHVLATGLQLAVRIVFQQGVPIGRWSRENGVALSLVANSPTV